jgi:hypothetical protein
MKYRLILIIIGMMMHALISGIMIALGGIGITADGQITLAVVLTIFIINWQLIFRELNRPMIGAAISSLMMGILANFDPNILNPGQQLEFAGWHVLFIGVILVTEPLFALFRTITRHIYTPRN